MPTEPKKVLCIHSFAAAGRCSLAIITPVLAVMGFQPVALPTVLLSAHTGGLGSPARLDCSGWCHEALSHYRTLGFAPDCIYTGYLGSEALTGLAAEAFRLWPDALKIVDPAIADNGKLYAGISPEALAGVRALVRQADVILPNLTEAKLLLGLDPAEPAQPVEEQEALALAAQLAADGRQALVTGLPMGRYIGCAGGGREPFVVRHLRIGRSYHGTGDLFGAIVTGALLRGNALSAAADAAAGFVAQAIQNTPAAADERYGVWFEPLLPRLSPMPEI